MCALWRNVEILLQGMHDDQWKDTVAMIKSKFTVLGDGRREVEDIPRAFVEFIEFQSPMGRMKMERTTSPAVLDKKTLYSKTAGRAGQIEYVYSETEFSHRLKAYKWSEGLGEWEEIKAPL